MKAFFKLLILSISIFMLMPDAILASVYHSNDHYKFGSSSIHFKDDGIYQFLEAPNHNDWNFGSGSFTIDFWLYPTTLGTKINEVVRAMEFGYDPNDSHQNDLSISWRLETNLTEPYGYGIHFSGKDDNFSSFNYRTDTTNFCNEWRHIALVRNSNNFKVFLNGSEVLSETINFGIRDNKTMPLKIGTATSNGKWFFWDGYMDEIRISDSARWTENFTPPDSSYQVDSETLLLIQSDTFAGDTTFSDSSSRHTVSIGVPGPPPPPVPIPGAVWLLGSGLFGILSIRRKYGKNCHSAI